MRPIWRRTDVDTTKDYVLFLIESDSGDRDFELRDLSNTKDEALNGRCVLRTEIVPVNLVLSGDIFGIAEKVKLTDGRGFGFDSNGRWYTDEEYEDFVRRSHE